MPRVASPRSLLALCLAVAAFAVPMRWCHAQEASIPGLSYFAAIEELYEANYRRAVRSFAAEIRTPVRIGNAYWVDSICYRAMLGETYYQMGENALALEEFNAACELFLLHPRWLLTVQFRQNPRADLNSARRMAPWGRPVRQVTYGTFTDTMLVSQGELFTENRLRQGGAVQSLQMWRLNVVEVLRTTALAIRRRNEILGPLGPHDRLSKNLVDALTRGGNAPRNHWSNAWTELLLGLAQRGVGESQQATTHISRGLLIDGRYDHPLTGAALLAQGELALEAGNTKAALGLATEASYAAFAYEDYDVIGESMRLGHQAFLAGGGEGVYPPLAGAATWARRERLAHLASSFWLAQAEELALAGQSSLASKQIGKIPARVRDLGAGRLGSIRAYVEAMIYFAEGNREQGDRRIGEALAQKRGQSLRNFQTRLANARVDGGQVSARIAVGLYAQLLRDPTPRDWAEEPLETLAHLTTSHEPAIGRWLVAALSRQEVFPAIDITEVAKRRRFWRAQPLGGRLLAIEYLLEVDPARLSAEARLQRRQLLLQAPAYAELLKKDSALRREMAADQLVDQKGNWPQKQKTRLKQLGKNAQQRITLLGQLALRRDPTNFDMLPRPTAVEIQAALQPGGAMLLFHQSGTSFFAFVLTADGYHHWRLLEAGSLGERTSELLRQMGHFSQSRILSTSDLDTEAWKQVAQPYSDTLFRDSRLDWAATEELLLIPDGVLWHVPFEALVVSAGGDRQLLIDQTPIRYAPTAGFAIGDSFRPRPIRTTAIAAPTRAGGDDFLNRQLLDELQASVQNPIVLGGPLPAPSPLVASLVEQLVVLSESTLEPANPYAWTPVPLDRNAGVGTLSAWLSLPRPGSERLLLAGVHTAAETGLKSRKRNRDDDSIASGNELFHASCALLATGAKTVLLSRWQTSGQTHREILREFLAELPHVPASDAWRRSLTLARQLPLDPDQEPRVKRPNESTSLPKADHPFLWSGYLLIDTGYDPTSPE